MDYFQARELLRHAGTRRIMARKKIGNNTYARGEVPDNGHAENSSSYNVTALGADVVIRLHSTDIVRFRYDGTVTFDSGGWLSVTTKARMNEYGAPYRFSAHRGEWHVTALAPRTPTADDPRAYPVWDETMPTVTFRDGLTLSTADPRRSLELELLTPEARAAAELLERDRATKKRISAYLRGVTEGKVFELLEHGKEHGTAGDCLFCQLAANPANDSSALGSDHLELHLEERYYMLTMMHTALLECGYRDAGAIIHMSAREGSTRGADMVKRALRRYLEARLLEGASSGRRGSALVSRGWA